MPDKVKISELDTATSVTGSTYLAVDDGTYTKKITVDNYNASANTTARGYALQAAASATEAANSVTAVNATAAEVQLSINRAVELAGQASNSASAASASASDASREASAAATSALTASQHASAAQESAALVDSAATLSRSWAVGGTNSREGEDANNSRYWAQMASAAAGGGVQTFNSRNGYVAPQSGDYSAAMVSFNRSGTDINADTTQDAIVQVNNKINGKAPTNHALNGTTYGIGTSGLFGHVKPSNTYNTLAGNADQGIVASQKAVYDAYTNLDGKINTANGNISALSNSLTDSVRTLNDSISNVSTTSSTQYRELRDELIANGQRIYMDYQGGKYGYNTSANRGADTFHPFSDTQGIYNALVAKGIYPASDSPTDIINAINSTMYQIYAALGAKGVYATDDSLGSLLAAINTIVLDVQHTVFVTWDYQGDEGGIMYHIVAKVDGVEVYNEAWQHRDSYQITV